MPVEKLLNETKKYLAPDEESLDTIEGDLDYQNERMMGALSITNKRIVFCAKKLLGGFVFKELPSTISSIEIKGRVMILNTTTGEKIKFSVLTPFLNTSKKQDVEKFIKTVEEKLNIKRIEVSEKPILKRGWVWLVIFASIFIVILFAISGGKKETIPQVTQPLQQEFQKPKAETPTQPQKETQSTVILNSVGETTPIIVGISPKEFDQKGKKFLIKGDGDGLVKFAETYLKVIPNNIKVLVLGEETVLEPDLDVGRKQVEYFVKIKILEGPYKNTVGWVNRSGIKIIEK